MRKDNSTVEIGRDDDKVCPTLYDRKKNFSTSQPIPALLEWTKLIYARKYRGIQEHEERAGPNMDSRSRKRSKKKEDKETKRGGKS